MARLTSFEELEEHVRQVLCSRADVAIDTPLLACPLRRGPYRCGVEFLLLAPRAVRLSAIWEARSGRILFYDQNLERFLVTRVTGLSVEHIPSKETRPALASAWRGK